MNYEFRDKDGTLRVRFSKACAESMIRTNEGHWSLYELDNGRRTRAYIFAANSSWSDYRNFSIHIWQGDMLIEPTEEE